jgi:alpha,alpha-trehalase
MAEDAVSGVIAGRCGGFALVLGVDRHHTGTLASNGANWVINDFSEINVDQVSAFVRARAPAA